MSFEWRRSSRSMRSQRGWHCRKRPCTTGSGTGRWGGRGVSRPDSGRAAEQRGQTTGGSRNRLCRRRCRLRRPYAAADPSRLRRALHRRGLQAKAAHRVDLQFGSHHRRTRGGLATTLVRQVSNHPCPVPRGSGRRDASRFLGDDYWRRSVWHSPIAQVKQTAACELASGAASTASRQSTCMTRCCGRGSRAGWIAFSRTGD